MIKKVRNIPKKKFILWLSGGVIAIVLLTGLMFKERITGVVMSWVLSARYTQDVRKSHKTMNEELESPLKALGFTIDLELPGGCGYDDGFQIFRCSTITRGETGIINEEYIRSYSDEVRHLEQLVSQKGWATRASEGTTPSLERLLSPEEGDPHMAGYYGSIHYEKNIDGFICSLKISRFDHLFGVLACHRAFSRFEPHFTRTQFIVSEVCQLCGT